MDLLPLERLGVHEGRDGSISFGALLPDVGPRFRVSVKVIHTDDQFLQDVAPREFRLKHSTDPASGKDYWSTTVKLGREGRYVYRYCVTPEKGQPIDWISDPFAREFGIGALSAFTVGYEPYAWSESEASWKTPQIHDLVFYEMMLAEFAGNLRRAADLLPYLADLGINCIELMPVTNSGVAVDWGFLPIGYFGVAARYGSRVDMHRFVDQAHSLGIAVILDSVFGHTGDLFGSHYLYEELHKQGLQIDHPFTGVTDRALFGEPTDWRRSLTANFFFTVSHFWLDRFHIDGFRYDCVPEFFGGPKAGFTALVENTWKHVQQQREGHWERFHGENGTFNLITCAEHVDAPRQVLESTYANCVWQDETLGAAKDIAESSKRDVTALGQAMALFNFPFDVPEASDKVPKAAVQYIENHDQMRFICRFDRNEKKELFTQCDRNNWQRLRPYLIALLTAKGIPLLWQGQEFCENYWLPSGGVGRPHFPRPLRWELMYTVPGQQLLRLVRQLLRIRRLRTELRRGEHFVYSDYTQKGILIVRRGNTPPDVTVVALNFTAREVTVPFTYPAPGLWIDALVTGGGDMLDSATEEISIPRNFGRVLMLS
jgi:1,4-alpha-glucan branching enzyme